MVWFDLYKVQNQAKLINVERVPVSVYPWGYVSLLEGPWGVCVCGGGISGGARNVLRQIWVLLTGACSICENSLRRAFVISAPFWMQIIFQ